MFSSRSQRLFGDDLFNSNRERNADNTDELDYNCGGYALGTFSWYLPSHLTYSHWENWFGDEIDEDDLEAITDLAVEAMLEDFADLRLIDRLDEVRHDEYAIAFRVSSDGDFHYIKQGRSRFWTHKCGASRIFTMTRWEVFNTEWCHRYDGPIVLFAKKRG